MVSSTQNLTMNLLGTPCSVLVTLRYKHGRFCGFLFYLEFFLFCWSNGFISWSWRCTGHDLGHGMRLSDPNWAFETAGITLQNCMEHRQPCLLSSPCFRVHSPEWGIPRRMLRPGRADWSKQSQNQTEEKVSIGDDQDSHDWLHSKLIQKKVE